MITFQTFKQRQSSNEAEAKYLPKMMSKAFNEHLSEIVTNKSARKEDSWANKIAIAKYEMRYIRPSVADMQDYLTEYKEEQSKKIIPMPLFSQREMQLKAVA